MSQISYGTITITDTNDIERIYVVYAKSTGNTIDDIPTMAAETWEESLAAAPGEGNYIWQRTVVEKAGTHEKSYGSPVCITGEKGDSGRSLDNTITEYTCIEPYKLTEDTVIDISKTYYIRTIINNFYTFTLVQEPILKDLRTYYEDNIISDNNHTEPHNECAWFTQLNADLIKTEYVPTLDEVIDESKTYYIKIIASDEEIYQVVTNPQVEDISTYYEFVKTILNCWTRITNTYVDPNSTEFIIYKDEGINNLIFALTQTNLMVDDINNQINQIQHQLDTTNTDLTNDLTVYKNANDLEISSIKSRIKNIWIEEETVGERLAGLYAASGIDSQLDFDDPETYGYNMVLRHNALDFRYNTINFTELSTDALTFYYPKKDLSSIDEQWTQGESAIKINADGLFLYNKMKSFLKTEDTQIDASKQYYILEDGNYELVNNPNIEDINNYYEVQTVEDADGKNLEKRLAVKMNTEGLQIINGSPNGHENGNITLSTLPFERELVLKGNLVQPVLTETPTDLLLAIGSKFGVSADGTLYANGAHITEIQAEEISGLNANTLGEIQATNNAYGKINFPKGTFFFGDNIDIYQSNQGISWDGTNLLIKGAIEIVGDISNVAKDTDIKDIYEPYIETAPDGDTQAIAIGKRGFGYTLTKDTTVASIGSGTPLKNLLVQSSFNFNGIEDGINGVLDKNGRLICNYEQALQAYETAGESLSDGTFYIEGTQQPSTNTIFQFLAESLEEFEEPLGLNTHYNASFNFIYNGIAYRVFCKKNSGEYSIIFTFYRLTKEYYFYNTNTNTYDLVTNFNNDDNPSTLGYYELTSLYSSNAPNRTLINDYGVFFFKGTNTNINEFYNWFRTLKPKPQAWTTATEFFAPQGIYNRMKMRVIDYTSENASVSLIGDHTWLARSNGHLSLKLMRDDYEQ